MTDLTVWSALPYWPALFFWSGVVVGLVSSCFGLFRRSVSLSIGGAGVMLPASLYLAVTPRFQYVGLVPVACLLLAAHEVRRDRVWIGGFLIAGAALFWTVVASMLHVPILLHVLVAGGAIGIVAARDARWRLLVYLPIGIAGAFAGALLSFGDAPLLMRHPSLNPWTLSVIASALLVTALAVVDQKVFSH